MCAFLAGPALSQTSNTDPVAELLKQGKNEVASNHYEDAVKTFKKANQLQHDACADCYLDLAMAQIKLGEFDEAIKSCDKAILFAKDDRQRLEGHTLKGNILQDNPKKWKASESEYRAALGLEENDPIAHFNLGILLLRESEGAEGIQELNTYLQLAPDGRDANYARKLIANPKHAGEPLAPDFKIETSDGEDISLHDLAGKIVVMDFWATWCPPCVSSVPQLKELTQKYPRTKLVLISISADSNQQSWREFITTRKMDWPQYRDSDGGIRKSFAVNAFPTYLVIDPEGFIQQRIVGLDPQQTVVFRLKDALRTMLPSE